MSAEANYFKLGLFVLLAFTGSTATAIAVGATASKKKTIEYHTYFNESVQGLNVGAPVTFRGVQIGTVSEIRIAPDHRQVEVIENLVADDIRRMGLQEQGDTTIRFDIPDDLRAQLGSQGITGVKFILIDFFDPKANPLPELSFEPHSNYIPAAASLMKNLEDSIVKAVDKFPELADSVASITRRIDSILEDVQSKNVPAQAVSTMHEAELALQDLRKVLGHVDQAQLPAKASEALANLDKSISRLNTTFDQINGPHGLLASATHATDTFGNAGQDASQGLRQLDDTLRDVGDAAQSIRDLANALERDPDMLIHGKSKRAKQP